MKVSLTNDGAVIATYPARRRGCLWVAQTCVVSLVVAVVLEIVRSDRGAVERRYGCEKDPKLVISKRS